MGTNVFEQGKLAVKFITVEKSSNDSSSSSPPKPLFIVTPTVEGKYPVLLFLHGTCVRNTSYGQLLRHISSHGFIVVAPQLYSCLLTPETEEINSAAAVTTWLSTGLPSILPETVQPNLLNLALAGHSRGGKSAFALALGHAQTSLKFSLLIGLDPVAGLSPACRTDPKILTYVPRSFDLTIPVAVIGTGLGHERKYGVLPPCAPNGVSHGAFFAECKPPCAYFYATGYGHMDVLDAATAMSCVCAGAKEGKDGFRACLGGVFVAVLRAFLEGESGDFRAILDDPGIAPVTLDPVIFVEA